MAGFLNLYRLSRAVEICCIVALRLQIIHCDTVFTSKGLCLEKFNGW